MYVYIKWIALLCQNSIPALACTFNSISHTYLTNLYDNQARMMSCMYTQAHTTYTQPTHRPTFWIKAIFITINQVLGSHRSVCTLFKI